LISPRGLGFGLAGVLAGEAQRALVTDRVGREGALRRDGTGGRRNGGGGVRVAMSVDDVVDLVCEHAHPGPPD